MLFTKNIITVAALCSFVSASPTPSEDMAAGTVAVTCFSGDTCNGSSDPTVTIGDGGRRCFAVSNKRSISVSGNCRVTTWSGNDCAGSSYNVPRGGCFSVLYASVSIDC